MNLFPPALFPHAHFLCIPGRWKLIAYFVCVMIMDIYMKFRTSGTVLSCKYSVLGYFGSFTRSLKLFIYFMCVKIMDKYTFGKTGTLPPWKYLVFAISAHLREVGR